MFAKIHHFVKKKSAILKKKENFNINFQKKKEILG